MRLNDSRRPVPPEATILVSGPPRSGTSLAAAALHAAGLWLGDDIDSAVFEDTNWAGPLGDHIPLAGRLRAAARHPRHWRTALAGLDLHVLTHLISHHNARFTRWGLKRPNITRLLDLDPSLSLFRQPRLVMVFRDPIGLAERIALAETMDLSNAVRFARLYIGENLWVASRMRVPTLLVSYEKANANRDAFLDELYAFGGLEVDRAAYPEINARIDAAGGAYLERAAAVNRGFVDGYVDGALVGWCRTPGLDAPQVVDIYADEERVARVLADGYSEDLRKAGFGDGRHRFHVPLDHLGLSDACRLRAIIPSTNVEIQNSGLTLGMLKSSRRPFAPV